MLTIKILFAIIHFKKKKMLRQDTIYNSFR